MSGRAFFRAAAPGMAVHAAMAAVAFAYMSLLGAGWPDLVTLGLIWLGAAGGYYLWRFAAYRSYYRGLLASLQGLEQKYLLAGLPYEPALPELAPLWEALVQVGSSVAEQVARVEREALDHREYVEGWVHEVKAPIAAARLLAEGSGWDGARELIDELDRIEHLAEQALYYARSSAVEQDYFVRETALEEPVKAVLRRHARLFIANGVAVSLSGLELTVFTDRKWLEFILTQILTNAIKYRQASDPAVRIWAERHDDGVLLSVRDNGIGIPRADLGRVFEKGFTGENGRRFGRSTGVGLYLVRKLCHALGHQVSVGSEEGRSTCVSLFFPKGRLLRPQADRE